MTAVSQASLFHPLLVCDHIDLCVNCNQEVAKSGSNTLCLNLDYLSACGSKGSRLRRNYSAGKGVTEESEALNLSQGRDFLPQTN